MSDHTKSACSEFRFTFRHSHDGKHYQAFDLWSNHLLLKRQIHLRFDGTFGKNNNLAVKSRSLQHSNEMILPWWKQSKPHFWAIVLKLRFTMRNCDACFLTASLDTFLTHYYCEWVVETTGWNDKLFDFQSPFGVGEKPPLFSAMSEANKEEIDRCKQSLAWCGTSL